MFLHFDRCCKIIFENSCSHHGIVVAAFSAHCDQHQCFYVLAIKILSLFQLPHPLVKLLLCTWPMVWLSGPLVAGSEGGSQQVIAQTGQFLRGCQCIVCAGGVDSAIKTGRVPSLFGAVVCQCPG